VICQLPFIAYGTKSGLKIAYIESINPVRIRTNTNLSIDCLVLFSDNEIKKIRTASKKIMRLLYESLRFSDITVLKAIVKRKIRGKALNFHLKTRNLPEIPDFITDKASKTKIRYCMIAIVRSSTPPKDKRGIIIIEYKTSSISIFKTFKILSLDICILTIILLQDHNS